MQGTQTCSDNSLPYLSKREIGLTLNDSGRIALREYLNCSGHVQADEELLSFNRLVTGMTNEDDIDPEDADILQRWAFNPGSSRAIIGGHDMQLQ